MEPLRAQAQIIYALMLRDMRSRFFGNALGFAVAVAWPLVHIIILLLMYTASGRVTPYGDSLVLFFSTGLVPFITFSYMSRFIMYSLIMNRPLLGFPIVKITDVLFARSILECLGAIIMTIALLIILWFCDIDFVPHDIVQASFAFGSCILLGLGLGVVNAMIAMAFPMWATGYTLIVIALYASSGILFVPDSLPEILRYYLSFNPVLQSVEWMRSAYYDGYGTLVLDKGYVLTWGVLTLFGGLFIERFVRSRLLQA